MYLALRTALNPLLSYTLSSTTFLPSSLFPSQSTIILLKNQLIPLAFLKRVSHAQYLSAPECRLVCGTCTQISSYLHNPTQLARMPGWFFRRKRKSTPSSDERKPDTISSRSPTSTRTPEASTPSQLSPPLRARGAFVVHVPPPPSSRHDVLVQIPPPGFDMSSIPPEITDTNGDRHTLEGKLARAEMSRRRATALGKAASASMYYAQTLVHIGFEADHAYTQAWEDRRRSLSNQEPGPGKNRKLRLLRCRHTRKMVPRTARLLSR